MVVLTNLLGVAAANPRLSQVIVLFCMTLSLFSPETRADAAASTDDLVAQGRRIYQEGIVAPGIPLRGRRPDLVDVEGPAAACTTCHRPSGMGSFEGGITVPPITGRFLFATQDRPVALLDTRAPKNLSRAHDPYSDASIAQAIREGIDVAGHSMNPVMPQYTLTDPQIKALTAYLRQLSVALSPGVGADMIRFATIVTPGVEPKQRETLVNVMRAVFNQRNASQPHISGRMRMPIDLLPRVLRNWELSVWELTGEPQSWEAQLTEYYRQEPAFAVISGLSTTTWTPVQAFCEQQQIPCLFPSIDLPPDESAFYSLYYTRGVALEAEVLARYLRNRTQKTPQRLVQIYRDDTVGNGAAKALLKALDNSPISVEDRVLQAPGPAALSKLLSGLAADDVVMLWLRPTDLAVLQDAAPDHAKAAVYISGFLTQGAYKNISSTWQPQVRIVYPYEIGNQRRVNLATFQEWLKAWNLPQDNEEFQSEVFFNLLFLTDLTSQMLDNLYRDYLIERAEDMLGRGTNSTAYPRLSLAPGQRFASKGAYIARIDGDKLSAESDWIVP